MTRVHVVVEGPTEESFIKTILAPVFWFRQIYLIPVILGRPGQKGGNTSYARVKRDVVTLLKQHSTSYCTTMLDLYGLGPGFPGMPPPPNISNIDKVIRVEAAIKTEILREVPDQQADVRFIPYLQLHEYEGLLFSHPAAFASGIGQPNLAGRFSAIRQAFATPEDINDDPNTAPSKRVVGVYPAYRKVLDGTLAAQAVGIQTMRQQCPHFHDWIGRLEAL
jgi:hypothetical protein